VNQYVSGSPRARSHCRAGASALPTSPFACKRLPQRGQRHLSVQYIGGTDHPPLSREYGPTSPQRHPSRRQPGFTKARLWSNPRVLTTQGLTEGFQTGHSVVFQNSPLGRMAQGMTAPTTEHALANPGSTGGGQAPPSRCNLVRRTPLAWHSKEAGYPVSADALFRASARGRVSRRSWTWWRSCGRAGGRNRT